MSRARRVTLGIALVLVTAACATSAVVLTRGGDNDSPVLTSPPRTATTVAPTTATPTTLPPLPVPDASPDDPYADVPVVPIGSMSIPKIGLEHTIYEGVWLTVLNHGPGHWPNSAQPGQRGNTVFPAHRTTYSRPFHDLDLLAPGDHVVFHTQGVDHTYAVKETIIVKPTDMWVVDQTPTPTFTLVACHPKGSARERIVVKGELVSSTPQTKAGPA